MCSGWLPKVWPPLVWLATFVALSKVLPSIMEDICSLASADDLGFEEDDIIGFDDVNTYQRKQQMRIRKVNNFVSAHVTQDKLVSLTLTLRPCLRVLGGFFKASSRLNPSSRQCVLSLIWRGSPPQACAQECIDLLRNQGNDAWLPLNGGGRGWTGELYLIASVPMLLQLGAIYKRFHLAFDAWPWRL